MSEHRPWEAALTIREKVLVVDDSRTAREAVQLILEHAGYQVLLMDTALGVSNIVRDERPDLILMDVNMPALDGDKVVTLLRSRRRDDHTLVLLHSSRPETELAVLAARCGADGFLKKTLDPVILPAEVARWLARSPPATSSVAPNPPNKKSG